MPHQTALIATIAGGIGLAFLLGLAATRLRIAPLVGYLLAGILIGPFTPGWVADIGLAQQLAEIGVILLMFGVGIHFSVADLLAVRRIALPGAIAQIAVATALGSAVAHLWGWSWGSGLVFGLCLSVASTVVLLRALEDRRMLDSDDGRIAVGWLIVEDLATVLVLVLVLLPALSVPLGGRAADGVSTSPTDLVLTVVRMALELGAFVGLMFFVGRRAVPWLLERVARTGSRELFTLAVLAVALGIAVGAATVFGVSFALGAFLAGMVVNGSDLSHEAATDALPLQDAFAVLFFVAVGMLFDPMILLRQPLEVLAVILIVMIGKSVAAFVIVIGFRYPVRTALMISASLAQIGEFSFILAALGLSLGLLSPEAQSLIVAGAIGSITLNGAAFWMTRRLGTWIAGRPRLVAILDRQRAAGPEADESAALPPLRAHAIIVGYGRVGALIGEALQRQGLAFVAVDQDRERARSCRARAMAVVTGDGTRPAVLMQAALERARLLILALPEPFQAGAIIDHARAVNPVIQTIARAHSERSVLTWSATASTWSSSASTSLLSASRTTR